MSRIGSRRSWLSLAVDVIRVGLPVSTGNTSRFQSVGNSLGCRRSFVEDVDQNHRTILPRQLNQVIF
jgi:hypothetical protein